MKPALIALLLCYFSIAYAGAIESDSLSYYSPDSSSAISSKMLSNQPHLLKYDSVFVWTDRRTLSEITSDLPASYSYSFNNGGRNTISFDGLNDLETGVFMDGIQMNDNFFGGFDEALISVNDIEAIEKISALSSFIYGTSSQVNAVNVITKDKFRKVPFSQLRYSQDRFNSLSADLLFCLPVSRRFSLTMGLTKQSIDGRYNNSIYDVWNGRFRANLFPSKTTSVRADIYYNNTERGLNQGLGEGQSISESKDKNAAVNNPFSNEQIEQFHFGISATARFFGRMSLTKLTGYSSNTLREYRNNITDSGSVFEGFLPSENFHYIRNAVQLSQEGTVSISRQYSLNLFGSVSARQNLADKQISFSNDEMRISAKAELRHKQFGIALFAASGLNDFDASQISTGTEVDANIINRNSLLLRISGGINNTHNEFIAFTPYKSSKVFYESKLSLDYGKGLSFSQRFFAVNTYNSTAQAAPYLSGNYFGASTELSVLIWKIRSTARYMYTGSEFYPEHKADADICFQGQLFRDKLQLQAGFRGSYVRRRDSEYVYDQKFNAFTSVTNSYQKDQYGIDAYVGARIGKANVNLTVANIFDSFSYGAHIYPSDNRGGFINAISRFTIVWDFID